MVQSLMDTAECERIYALYVKSLQEAQVQARREDMRASIIRLAGL